MAEPMPLYTSFAWVHTFWSLEFEVLIHFQNKESWPRWNTLWHDSQETYWSFPYSLINLYVGKCLQAPETCIIGRKWIWEFSHEDGLYITVYSHMQNNILPIHSCRNILSNYVFFSPSIQNLLDNSFHFVWSWHRHPSCRHDYVAHYMYSLVHDLNLKQYGDYQLADSLHCVRLQVPLMCAPCPAQHLACSESK